MRSLLSSAVVALGLTTALLLILNFTLPAESWFRAFLFERSAVQWLAVAMFFFGAELFVRKGRRIALEQTHLAAAEWKIYPSDATSTVHRRISAVAKLAAHHSPSYCRDAARELADEDTQTLNESYVLPADVIGLLPLVGFFGTVWGLSKGLYNNFVLQGEDSTDSFANAIGTAFDTTLLALFLTITLSIAQSLLRRSEQSLLERLDRFIEDQLLNLDATGTSPVPASNQPRVWLDEIGVDPAELIGYVRNRLGSMATDLGALSATNQSLTAAITELNATTATAAAAAADRPAPPAPPDPIPSLQALAAPVNDATAQARQHQASLSTEAAKQLAALTAIAAQLEATQARVVAAQADLRTTLSSTGEAITAELRTSSREQQSSLAAWQKDSAAQHQRTRDLINRPKSFTVTEAPDRDHDAKA